MKLLVYKTGINGRKYLEEPDRIYCDGKQEEGRKEIARIPYKKHLLDTGGVKSPCFAYAPMKTKTVYKEKKRECK